MIVEARRKRDKHWNLIKRINRRVHRSSIVVQTIKPNVYQSDHERRIQEAVQAAERQEKQESSNSSGLLGINMSASQKLEQPTMNKLQSMPTENEHSTQVRANS